MKGLPRQPSRVAQTRAVAEKQKYFAVLYGDERGHQGEGSNRAAPCHFISRLTPNLFELLLRAKPKIEISRFNGLLPKSIVFAQSVKPIGIMLLIESR